MIETTGKKTGGHKVEGEKANYKKKFFTHKIPLTDCPHFLPHLHCPITFSPALALDLNLDREQ